MSADFDAVQSQPAILIDIVDLMPALMRLRYANPKPAWRKRLVLLRWADVIRKFSPEDALAVLDELPHAEDPEIPQLQPEVVRAAALLEQGHYEEAAMVCALVPAEDGVADLLKGRIAYQRGKLATAQKHYASAHHLAEASSAPLSVETQAEALSYLARLEMQQGLGNTAWGRLATLAEAHNAPFTQSLAQMFQKADEEQLIPQLASVLGAVARRSIEGDYAAPYLGIREQIDPFPVHVHGAAKRHEDDPEAYGKAILTMASLAWRIGHRTEGFETAFYGQRLAARVFGDPVATELREFVYLLLQPLSLPERAELRAAINQRAAS